MRGLVLTAKGDFAAAEDHLRLGLSFALEAGDQFEEALMRESIAEVESRIGKGPDPENEDRLSALFDLLGIRNRSQALIRS
jgi:hypothetical protein